MLRAMGLSTDSAEASIRFSLGRNTTEGDVADAIAMIEEALETTLLNNSSVAE